MADSPETHDLDAAWAALQKPPVTKPQHFVSNPWTDFFDRLAAIEARLTALEAKVGIKEPE